MIPLIAAGLYGMAGWQNKKNRDRSNAREHAADAQKNELHLARMEEIAATKKARDEEQAYKDDLKTRLSAGQQTPVMQGIGDGGSNFDVKDPAVAAVMADMAGAKGENVALNDATRVSTGAVGATHGGSVPGRQVIADPAQAQAVAKNMTLNDHQELLARRESARKFGKVDISDEIRGKLQTLEREGAFRALALAKNGDFEGAAKHYQATGADRMPEGGRFDSAIVVDPTTKAQRTVIRLVGKDGVPVISDVDMALRSYLTPTEQYNMGSGDKKAELDERRVAAAEQSAETARLAQIANEKKIDAFIFGGGMTGRAGGGRGSGGGRGVGEGGAAGGQAPGIMPDPMVNFDPKKAYAASVEQAIAEIGQPGKDGKPVAPAVIAKRATEIYRAMEGEFRVTGQEAQTLQTIKGMAARAQTPEHLAVVWEHGTKFGMTPAQMISIDPRLAELAKPKDASKAGTNVTANKDAATPKPPVRPIARDPNAAANEILAKSQAHFRQSAGKLEAFNKDPEVQRLRQEHTQAIRAGKPMVANNIMAQIDQMKQKHLAQ